MPSTRSSARVAEKTNSSSPPSEKTGGTKRKAGEATSPTSTKSKRPSKEQKTLEESIPTPAGASSKEKHQSNGAETGTNGEIKDADVEDDTTQPETNGNEKEDGAEKEITEKSVPDETMEDADDAGEMDKSQVNEEAADGTVKGTAVEEDQKREKSQPSNVLEKGIIYFFTRGRVGVDDPDSVTNLQRSYFVLRALPTGGKITDGAIQDVGNNRLIALPKKVWPKSGKDRFMAFVEKSKVSMATLKEEFFQGSEYRTQTSGVRHTPEVTPVGEGVYAMTSSGEGRTTTHLAYMLTIPQEIGEVQKDLGLAKKGSFILSSKNPKASSPAYAQLPATPDYPQEIIDEFAGRGWLPSKPEHFDYENASMLLIGESIDGGSALEATAGDQKNEEKEVPEEELIKLEEEDEERIQNAKGDNTIFEDLGISSKEYPKVKSTW